MTESRSTGPLPRGDGEPRSNGLPLVDDLAGLARIAYRNARRFVVLLIGATLLLVGAALLVLPGPGFAVIFLGLVILATEFVWARRLLKRVRQQADRVVQAARGTRGSGGEGGPAGDSGTPAG